jgi:hypothetical protein
MKARKSRPASAKKSRSVKAKKSKPAKANKLRGKRDAAGDKRHSKEGDYAAAMQERLANRREMHITALAPFPGDPFRFDK